MTLLVDVGNSRIKWSRANQGSLEGGSHAQRGEPLEEALNGAWAELHTPRAVLICSVAGDRFNARMEQWIINRWGLKPGWFHTRPQTLGIVNGYVDYAQLGSDRWAAMLGARALQPGPLGVIDCGTAVTLDVVDADDRHLGGLILPGLELMRRSLTAGTAHIREVAARPAELLGRTTAECVASGTSLGLAGALEHWMKEVGSLRAGLGWIATGGSWPSLSPMVGIPVRFDADLVLRGLARVAASDGGSPP